MRVQMAMQLLTIATVTPPSMWGEENGTGRGPGVRRMGFMGILDIHKTRQEERQGRLEAGRRLPARALERARRRAEARAATAKGARAAVSWRGAGREERLVRATRQEEGPRGRKRGAWARRASRKDREDKRRGRDQQAAEKRRDIGRKALPGLIWAIAILHRTGEAARRVAAGAANALAEAVVGAGHLQDKGLRAAAIAEAAADYVEGQGWDGAPLAVAVCAMMGIRQAYIWAQGRRQLGRTGGKGGRRQTEGGRAATWKRAMAAVAGQLGCGVGAVLWAGIDGAAAAVGRVVQENRWGRTAGRKRG